MPEFTFIFFITFDLMGRGWWGIWRWVVWSSAPMRRVPFVLI